MKSSMLQVNALSCQRAGMQVFDGVSFSLSSGQVLLLKGPNGAGKSTLLRSLAGFVRPVAGQIVWCGQDVAIDRDAFRTQSLYLGHANALRGALSVEENLLFLSRVHGGDERDDAQSLRFALHRMGIEELRHRPLRTLSQGQSRRVALARLSLSGASLWLLDEPTTALDSKAVALFYDRVRAHRDNGGMAIIATHMSIDIDNAAEVNLERRE